MSMVDFVEPAEILEISTHPYERRMFPLTLYWLDLAPTEGLEPPQKPRFVIWCSSF